MAVDGLTPISHVLTRWKFPLDTNPMLHLYFLVRVHYCSAYGQIHGCKGDEGDWFGYSQTIWFAQKMTTLEYMCDTVA